MEMSILFNDIYDYFYKHYSAIEEPSVRIFVRTEGSLSFDNHYADGSSSVKSMDFENSVKYHRSNPY